MKTFLSEQLISLGLKIDDHQLSKFQLYHNLLLEWNKRTNLISKSDEKFLIERHFFDSLSILKNAEFRELSTLVDVGTGAGFPGLPIAIMRNDLNIILVESKRMKVLFLRKAIDVLNLTNVGVFEGRAENFVVDNSHIALYDGILTRAVGRLCKVYSWVEEILKVGGVFLAWKGGNIQDEVDELKAKYNYIAISFIEIKMSNNKFIVKIEKLR